MIAFHIVNRIIYLIVFAKLLGMYNKYFSCGLAFIMLSGIFYTIFGASYIVFGFRGFLIIAGVFFAVSILYGLWYCISYESPVE